MKRVLNAPGKEGQKKKRKKLNRILDEIQFQSRKRNRK